MTLPANFMEQVAACYGNPSAFSELVFGSPLHAGQQRYAANANSDVNFLLPGNSFGKTELIARLVTYNCWFKDGVERPTNFSDWLSQEYKALVASFSYTIGMESFERLKNVYQNREEFRVLVKSMKNSDVTRIEFNNGAICDWGSLDGQGKLVEAARRRIIFVDEAGHIPDLAGTFDNILYPRTMGVSGRIHLFGTPKAHSDPYLLEIYEKGKDGTDPFYFSQSGSVFENEFWPDREKERVLANPRYVTGWEDCPEGGCEENLACRDGKHPILTLMGRQVILGAFIIAGGFFFNRHHIQRLFSGEHNGVWLGDTRYTVEPEEGRLYLGAFDLGGNRKRKRRNVGSDATVGVVVDYTERPWQVVRYEYIEGGSADWQQKYDLMADIFKQYSMPYLLIDSTGQIDSVSEALQDRGVEVEGIHFGGAGSKKFDMLRSLQLALELEWDTVRGLIRSPMLERMKYELDHYVLPDDDIVQDNVMVMAMLVHHLGQWELPAATMGEVF